MILWLAEERAVRRIEAVGRLGCVVQHGTEPVAVNGVIQRLADTDVVEDGTVRAVQHIGIDVRIRPKADLEASIT